MRDDSVPGLMAGLSLRATKKQNVTLPWELQPVTRPAAEDVHGKRRYATRSRTTALHSPPACDAHSLDVHTE